MTDTSSVEQQNVPSWLSDYQGIASDAGNAQRFLQHLSGLSADEVHIRATEMMRILRNNGFTEHGEQPQWQLDAFPLVMEDAEWQEIAAGIRQRMKLISAVMRDLVGEKRLITQGIISPTLLMQHPNYLRERFTLDTPLDSYFITAFDIGRDTQGQFYVLRDHCQFPRGLGFALENRIITRRVMSEEFADVGVKRMTGFVSKLQQGINDAAPGVSDPRVVILGQNPEEKFYSEQAFLASYLGYPLVRSADLTVRKGKVWLKALDGLKKVDVILRWIEDRNLDPLEQTEYSPVGIPGLLQAIRKGHVTIVNTFGNSLVQTPAVQQQFPKIAKSLLGESLLLQQPIIQTPDNIQENEWGNYQLRSWTHSDLRLDGEREAEQITDILDKNNADVYFEQKVDLLKAPFWVKKQLQEKPVITRFYALQNGNEVSVLPGALCFSVSMGGTSDKVYVKDTWLKYSQTTTEQSENTQAVPLSGLRRKASDMALMEGLISSRTAESLYWLGTELERGGNSARLLRLYIDRFSEQALYPDEKNLRVMERLRAGIWQQNLLYPYVTPDQDSDFDKSVTYKRVAQQGLQGVELPGSLVNTLTHAINNAIQVRELLSYDSLRIVENLEDELRKIKKFTHGTATHMMQSALDRTIGYLMAFNGSLLDSMSTTNGSFMLDIGRRVERISQLVAMLETLLGEELLEVEQMSLLETLLTAQVSSITHKRRYRMYQAVETGLELLIFDSEYPRSLVYQLDQLIHLCQKLPRKQAMGLYSNTEKILLRLKSDCIITDSDILCQVEHGLRENLIKLIHGVRDQIKIFQEILHTQYFSHTKTAKKLSWQLETKQNREST